MTRLSDEQSYQSTPNKILHEQLMNPNVPKNEREWYASRLIEKLQGEVESLSKSNLSLKQLAQDMAEKSNKEIARLKELGYTTLNDYREESKMRIEAEKELAQLTAKHERLVKEITPFFKRMGFPRYDENETNDYICNSGDFDKAMCAYKLALTEEGNV